METAEQWAALITEAWQASVEAIIECGKRLIAAKADPKMAGKFEGMVERDLPFGPRTARRLMAIAHCEFLTDRTKWSVLPPYWRTLTELAKLTREEFEAGIADKTIHPEMRGSDVPRLQRAGSLSSAISLAGCDVADLHSLVTAGRRFACIYADPPWRYGNQATRANAGDEYGDMGIDELCALPIKELAAENAHLHLWTTASFRFEPAKIIAAWGFEYRSELIWTKSGGFGTGNYWRMAHETLLTCIRGDARRFNNKSMSSWYPSWIECDRGEHSEKPEQVREMIMRASEGPYLELFGRKSTKAISPPDVWTIWGDQVDKHNLFAAAAA